MGNKKRVDKKVAQVKNINTRITRSQVKVSVSVKKLKKIDHSEKLNVRVTRASKPNEKKIAVKAAEEFEKLAKRITRSSTKKSQNSIQHVQQVAPSIEPTKKSVVKRADFYKLNTFEKDLIVLAKQKYSVPWPARIIKVEKNKVLVFFFGDKRSGFVSSSEIYDLVKSFHALRSVILSKKKPAGYTTGMREVELLLGISDKDSILNII